VPDRALVVRRIYDLYDSGVSIKDIVRQLYADGIPTARGGAWQTSTVFGILHNPVYCGRPQGFQWSRGTAPIPMPPGLAPELVPLEQWERVQRRLAHSAANPTGPIKRPDATLLRGGLSVCGYCGWRMHVQWWDDTPYYMCGQRTKLLHTHTCPGMPTINAANLDRAVWLRAEARLRGAADIDSPAMRRVEQDRVTVADALLAQIERERTRVMRELTQTDDADLTALWRQELAALGERKRAADAARVDALNSVERERAIAERVRLVAAGMSVTPTQDERRAALFAIGLQVKVYRRGSQPRWEVGYTQPVN
jgi:hypothetical protein